MTRLAAVIPQVGGDAPLDGLPAGGPREVQSLAGVLRDTQATLRRKLKHAGITDDE